MSEQRSARILVVANRTAATPALIEAVRERARRSSCSFALLVPQLACEVPYGDEEARRTLELAIPLLEEADVLVDGMRGSSSLWYRIRVNLQHVPAAQRPAQAELEVDYDPWKGYRGAQRPPTRR